MWDLNIHPLTFVALIVAAVALAAVTLLLIWVMGSRLRRRLRHWAQTSPWGAAVHDVECICGSDECQGQTFFRRGYVEINHRHKVEERWDFLYIESRNSDGHTEVMLPPERARELMWFLIRSYFPGYAFLTRAARRVKYQLFFPLRKLGWHALRGLQSGKRALVRALREAWS